MALENYEDIGFTISPSCTKTTDKETLFLEGLSLHPKSLELGLPERKERRTTLRFSVSRWVPGCGHV